VRLSDNIVKYRALSALEMYLSTPTSGEAGNDTESLSALLAVEYRIDPCIGGTYTAAKV
jgi:hypothetical protein